MVSYFLLELKQCFREGVPFRLEWFKCTVWCSGRLFNQLEQITLVNHYSTNNSNSVNFLHPYYILTGIDGVRLCRLTDYLTHRKSLINLRSLLLFGNIIQIQHILNDIRFVGSLNTGVLGSISDIFNINIDIQIIFYRLKLGEISQYKS